MTTTLPNASINVSRVIGTVPFTVNFAGLITNTPLNWTWDFGDGKKESFKSPDNNTSQNASMSYTYTTDGIFSVILNGTNSNGSSDIFSTQIIVTKPNAPSAPFSFTPNVNEPLSITFTGTSTGNPLGWLWDFGDNTTSNTQNSIHTYKTPGTYDVYFVEIHSNGAHKTSMQTINVTDSMLSAIISSYGLIIGISICICIISFIFCIISLFISKQ
jgi:PKD repeat protein